MISDSSFHTGHDTVEPNRRAYLMRGISVIWEWKAFFGKCCLTFIFVATISLRNLNIPVITGSPDVIRCLPCMIFYMICQ